MEQALLFEGKFALVKDPELGYLSLRVNPNNVFKDNLQAIIDSLKAINVKPILVGLSENNCENKKIFSSVFNIYQIKFSYFTC